MLVTIFFPIFALCMEKVRAIVLRTVRYNDRKLIVDLYTDIHGRMACVMPLKCRLIPLNIIDMETEYHPSHCLQTVKSLMSISHAYVLQEIRFNPVKSAIALFLAEFLNNILKEEVANQDLFDYLSTSIRILDKSQRGTANFHITFMMRLTRLMGICPNLDGKDDTAYFDLADGNYTQAIPPHRHFLMPDEARVLPWLFRMDFRNMHLFRLSHTQRNRCLGILTEYYRLHLFNFGELKSQDVLQGMFD